MSEPAFKRFTAFQRVLHWCVAIPYIVLLVTGAIIVLRHLGWVRAASLARAGALHRWAGIAFTVIVLEMLFAAIVGGYWRALSRDVLEWITPRPRDLLWLICIPLNTCFPRLVPLPAAGRYNAGQKLHGLFILVAVTGFILTGLAMIFIPGWLKVWVVHTWLFFGAVAFLSLHLFLAFVNPATRRALGGIFTGNVPHAYVRNHHAIVLNESPRERNHHAAVSIKAMILTSLVAFGALAVWWHGPGEHLVRASLASPRENVMVSPGDLISAHSKPLRGDHCIACHTQSGQPTMAACLECHAEIRTVLDQRVGYHGKLARDCTSCHKEHQGAEADLRSFDPIAFNHQQARFALNGAHRAAKCDQCHLDHSPTPGLRRYIGLNASSCVDCHANPHRDMPSADCAHCHSEQSWNAHDLRFEHNRDSTFKLDATHIVLACAACHPTKPNAASVFRGTPTACEKCHAPIADAMAGKIGDLAMKSDPHNGRVACAECHRPEVRSATMAQFAAECERCHGPRYRDLLFDWQKSLDDREQSAKLRMQRQLAADPQAMKLWSARLAAAHSAGIHNMQQAIEVLENTGR